MNCNRNRFLRTIIHRPKWDVLLILSAMVSLLATSVLACAPALQPMTQSTSLDAKAELSRARKLYEAGQFEESAVLFEQASKTASDAAMKIDAGTGQASALLALGLNDQAIDLLRSALQSAQSRADTPRLISIKNNLAAALILSRSFGPADTGAAPESNMHARHIHGAGGDAVAPSTQPIRPTPLLQDALHRAQIAGDRAAEARVLNNLGNLKSALGEIDQAADYYEQSAAKSSEINLPLLAAQAHANAAALDIVRAEIQDGRAIELMTTGLDFHQRAANSRAQPSQADYDRQRASKFDALAADARRNASGASVRADQACHDAIAKIDQIDDGHDKSMVLLLVGKTFQKIAQRMSDRQAEYLHDAYDAYRRAAATARRLGDVRAESYAVGCTASLYELQHDYPSAIALTNRAIFLAQQIQTTLFHGTGGEDLLYLWQWQNARILKASGQIDQALDAYRKAQDALHVVRFDVALGGGNCWGQRASFQQLVGDLYYESADLLLQQTSAANFDPEALQRRLKEAQDTVEVLKTAELDDYFRDRCANVIRAKTKPVGEIPDTDAAVIYYIPLQDRIEILLSVNSRLQRFTVSKKREELDAEIRRFARDLKDTTENRYIQTGYRLYQWLIKPLEAALPSGDKVTLVFVPDGMLRAIPMGALCIDERGTPLISRFAVATSPGLTLMEPRKPPSVRESQILLGGLSEAVEDFQALQHVPQELDHVSAIYSASRGATVLRNQNFNSARLTQEVSDNPYSVVHFASHGNCGNEAVDTFILTYDGRINLNDLERIMQPTMLRDRPIELLTLSACETASGSDRAALGLAGVAVKAGARSAVATLWTVDDIATANLMTDFYEQLQKGFPKAQALRQAQLKLISRSLRDAHPYYWAPYLLIGNWM